MKQLDYSIRIEASNSHVWETMLEREKYEQWVKAFSENSTFEGTWEQGGTIHFVDPNLGGTKAILEIFEPPNCILAKHVALIGKDGIVDTTSEAAKQWIGSTEKYIFLEHEGHTDLKIEMNTDEAFEEMFNTCWPEALENLKALSEAQDSPASVPT